MKRGGIVIAAAAVLALTGCGASQDEQLADAVDECVYGVLSVGDIAVDSPAFEDALDAVTTRCEADAEADPGAFIDLWG